MESVYQPNPYISTYIGYDIIQRYNYRKLICPFKRISSFINLFDEQRDTFNIVIKTQPICILKKHSELPYFGGISWKGSQTLFCMNDILDPWNLDNYLKYNFMIAISWAHTITEVFHINCCIPHAFMWSHKICIPSCKLTIVMNK